MVWDHFAADAPSGFAATTPRALGPNGRGPYGGVYITDSPVRRAVRQHHRLAVVYRHVLLVRRLCLVPLAPAVGLCPRLGLPKLWGKFCGGVGLSTEGKITAKLWWVNPNGRCLANGDSDPPKRAVWYKRCAMGAPQKGNDSRAPGATESIHTL